MSKILNYDELVKDKYKIEEIHKNTDIKKLKLLRKRLIKHMKEADGIGLAAPQLGINVRAAVITDWIATEHDFIINPSYKPAKGSVMVKAMEACLSVGDEIPYEVVRPDKIRVTYETIVKNRLKKFKRTLEGPLALVFMHETDHLNALTIKDIGKLL